VTTDHRRRTIRSVADHDNVAVEALPSPGGKEPGPTLERYESLLEVAGSIAAHPQLSELFQDLLQRLQQVVQFETLILVLHDPSKNVMRVNVLEALEPFTIPLSLEQPVEGSVAGWVWQHQQPLLLDDIEHETRFGRLVSLLRDSKIRSFYALPVTTARRRCGAICFASRNTGAYKPADLRFMEQAAIQVAIAVDAALTYETAENFQEKLAKEHERLKLLLEINNTLVRKLDLQALLAQISGCVRPLMRHDYFSLCLYDPADGQLRLHAVDFPSGGGTLRQDVVFPLEDSPAGRAFKTGKALLVNRLDIRNFPSRATELLLKEGIKSGCWLPLQGRERVIGTLNVGSLKETGFLSEDLELLSQIANQVAIAVDNALAFRQIAELKDQLTEEKGYLEDEIRTEYNFDEIVGESPVLKQVLQQVETVAVTDSTVLILGETGTGKELIARAIHDLSRRRERTLVKLNCAAIPTGLLESELFGHEKGAFTGAIAQKIGRLELANKGTLFLDEVGDIPLELQPKLLRVLQEQEFERLGGTRTIRVDVRLVVATNRDLDKMVAEGTFRQDLFYRLNVFPIRVPPLRERPGDIPLLVHFFVDKHARRMGRRIERIPKETMQALSHRHWPGNVRELENIIERAVILSPGAVLNVPLAELHSPAIAPTRTNTESMTLVDTEREAILHALQEADGVIARAAAKLGMKRTTLNSKMRKLGISRSMQFSH
jgi:formate hydrogenlyase transcriptional activator